MKKICLLLSLLLVCAFVPLGTAAADYLSFDSSSPVSSEPGAGKYSDTDPVAYPTNNANGIVKIRLAFLKNASLTKDVVAVKPVLDETYPFVQSNITNTINGLAGADKYTDFTITLKNNVYNGLYTVNFLASYEYNGTEETQTFPITIKVTGRAAPAAAEDIVNFDYSAAVGSSSYAAGYMPVCSKANSYTVAVPIPLKDLLAATSDISITNVSDGSFKPSNAVVSVAHTSDKAVATYNLTVATDKYNGIYPAVFKLAYMAGGVRQSKDITIYVRVQDKPQPSENTSTTTSQPRLMVSRYSIDKQSAVAGEEFTLTVDITNQSQNTTVQNVKMTINAGEVFVPSDGTNTAYVTSVKPQATQTLTFRFKTMPDALPKPASLTIEIAYEGKKSAAYTESATLSIPVAQPIRLKINEPNASTVAAGENMGVSFSVYNLGKSPLYNLMVSVEGEGIKAEENYYGGTLESGSSKSVDLSIIVDPSLYASAVPQSMPGDGSSNDVPEDGMVYADKGAVYSGAVIGNDGGQSSNVSVPGTVVISYEDATGKVYTEKKEFTGGIYVMPVSDPNVPSDIEEPVKETNLSWLWVVLGCFAGAAVIGGGVILALKASRKRKKDIEDALK